MSDIPLRSLIGKTRNSKAAGYEPLNRDDEERDGASTNMAVARIAASAAANVYAKRKGKGKQQWYTDDEPEDEVNLLRGGDYGDVEEAVAEVPRHEPVAYVSGI